MSNLSERNRPTQTPTQTAPRNSTVDLLNDLGEEMARMNRQTESLLFAVRFLLGFFLLSFFGAMMAAVVAAGGDPLAAIVMVTIGTIGFFVIWFCASRRVR